MSDKANDKPSGDARPAPSDDMSYGDYLRLDRILNAQCPLSSAHDEMLFIIQHQTTELWMRLVVYELRAARSAIREDELEIAFKILTRVTRIFEQLSSAWDVLRTMTPSEYAEFRYALGESSGIQSFQYREIEFLLGNRQQSMLKTYVNQPDILARFEDESKQPSLYDETLRLLARNGIDLPTEVLERDFSQPHTSHDAIVKAWREVYRAPKPHWPLYELAEKLVDLEDHFRRWRFNHVTTVERIIGLKTGTGGTAGVPYLRRMLEVVLFPDLWKVRTDL